MTARRPFRIALAAVLLGPAAQAPTGLVAVALSARDSVVLLHPVTLERVATLPAGRAPHEIAASPDGRRAYVANTGESAVSVLEIRPAQRIVATWPLPDSLRVHDLAANEDGRSVWAVSGEKSVALRLDPVTGRVVRRYPLSRAGGWMIELGFAGREVVVANLEGGAVTVLDPATGRERVFPRAEGEIDATLTPNGDEIWSVNLRNGLVSALDPTRGTVLLSHRLSGGPVRVVITPDGLTALVVSPGDSSVIAFDVIRRRARDTLAVAGGPKVIAVSPDGRRAYLTHPGRGLVTLIDLVTFRVVRTAEVPGTPDGVAVLEPVP